MTYVSPVPSVFGRDLIEQVRADSRDGDRMVPIVVEKCIDAVEALGMLFKLS
jgi:Rho-type GTPase-activating protein 1/2